MLTGAEWPLVAVTSPARVIVASCHSTPEVNDYAVLLRLRCAPAPMTAGGPAVSRNAEAARKERMFGEFVMIKISQELAQLQAEFDSLIEAWNALTGSERRREWGRYRDAEDQGGAGWHRFARRLVNSYCEGWCPVAGMSRDAGGQLVATASQAARSGGLWPPSFRAGWWCPRQLSIGRRTRCSRGGTLRADSAHTSEVPAVSRTA